MGGRWPGRDAAMGKRCEKGGSRREGDGAINGGGEKRRVDVRVWGVWRGLGRRSPAQMLDGGGPRAGVVSLGENRVRRAPTLGALSSSSQAASGFFHLHSTPSKGPVFTLKQQEQ